jgi:hypothetical protein
MRIEPSKDALDALLEEQSVIQIASMDINGATFGEDDNEFVACILSFRDRAGKLYNFGLDLPAATALNIGMAECVPSMLQKDAEIHESKPQ